MFIKMTQDIVKNFTNPAMKKFNGGGREICRLHWLESLYSKGFVDLLLGLLLEFLDLNGVHCRQLCQILNAK